MLSSLPPELLDLIVDHLDNEPIVLKACCLASKSWVHRTRRHLFAHVEFNGRNTSIESWMRAFPDPSDSPAHYARSLSICDLRSVTAAVTDARSWVHSFRHLVHLGVFAHARPNHSQDPLVQLRRLSPTLKSLHLRLYRIPLPEIFSLICSFPLLEDLGLIYLSGHDSIDGWNTPTSPNFTGCLDLTGTVSSITRGLLNLPGGLHFSKIKVSCLDHHAASVTALVLMCSDTLKYLFINFDSFSRAFRSASMADE